MAYNSVEEELAALNSGGAQSIEDELASLNAGIVQAAPATPDFGAGRPMSTVKDKTWGDRLRQITPDVRTPAVAAMFGVPNINAKDTAQMVGNAPGSVGRLFLNTAKGIGNLAGSALLPEAIQTEGMKATEEGIYRAGTNPRETLGNIWNGVKESYGSPEALRRTLTTDPAKIAIDASMALGGAGAIAKTGSLAAKAGGLGRTSLWLGDTAGTLGKAAVATGEAPFKAPFQVAKAAGRTFSKGAEKIGTYADNLRTPVELEKDLAAAVQHGMNKGVGRTYRGKDNYGNVIADQEKATQAVKTIVGNKNALELSTVEGDIVKGKLPETVMQFSQGVEQSKKAVFDKFNAMQVEAGQAGAKVPLDPAVKELMNFADDPVLLDKSPNVAQYARDKADLLSKRGAYTTEEAQRAIAAYNADLDAFYKNPSYNEASRVVIDAMVVNNLRKSLDSVIEGAVGPGYQALKNEYGALKSIQGDVTKRAIRESRKANKGLIDFTDIFTAGEAARAITGHTTLAPAVSMGLVKEFYKRINSPDRAVKNMFERADMITNNPRFNQPVAVSSNLPPVAPPKFDKTEMLKDNIFAPGGKRIPTGGSLWNP